MVKLREVVGLLLHAAGPAGTLGAELADDVDEIDNLDHDLPAGGKMVRQTDLTLAARSQDDVRDLKLIGELLERH